MSETRTPVPAPALSATSDVPATEPATEPVAAPVTETTTPVATPVATPTPAAPAAEPPARPITERISQLVQQRREADARAERLEKALETAISELKSRAAPAAPTPATATELNSSARPTRDAFGTPEEFESALIAWAGTQAASTASAEFQRQQKEAEAERAAAAARAEEERQAEAERAEMERRARELQIAWELRRAKALEAHPDFVEVAENNAIPITVAMGHVIATSDDGPEIAYYLGKNPSEAARIAALVIPDQVFPVGHQQAGLPVPNAIEQAFEMGKIAAKLSVGAPVAAPSAAAAAAAPTPATPLPAPPTPISGANANATARTIEEVGNEGSMEEYAARRTAQLIANRRPGQRGLLQ